MKDLIELIDKTASQDARGDNPDFNAMDCSGGNFDDAYQLGVNDGEIFFARILQKFIDKPTSSE